MSGELCIVGRAQMKTSWKARAGIQLKAGAAVWEGAEGKGWRREAGGRIPLAHTADLSKHYKSRRPSID